MRKYYKKFVKCANEKDSEGIKQCMSAELSNTRVDPYVSYEVEDNGYYEDSYADKGKYLERKYIAGDNILAIKVDGKKHFQTQKKLNDSVQFMYLLKTAIINGGSECLITINILIYHIFDCLSCDYRDICIK